jgi:hypothetical protein
MSNFFGPPFTPEKMRSRQKFENSAAAVLRARRHWRCRPFVFVSKVDPPLCEVVWRHFDRDTVTSKYPYSIFLHPAGGVGEGLVPVVELYSKSRVGQEFLYGTFEFD